MSHAKPTILLFGVTASFAYDAVGRRRQKTVNGVTTAFLYDGLDVVQELDGSTPIANLLTGLGIDEVLARTDAVGAQGFLTDGLGSTLALTDPAGSVLTEYTYEPFGKTTVTGAASTNAFKYTGREDDGTGLYYYRARYYHPGLQRFISQDPIGFRGGDVNLYAYVGNEPIDFRDPYGLLRIPWGRALGGLSDAAGNAFDGSGTGGYYGGAAGGAIGAVAGGAIGPHGAVAGGIVGGLVGGTFDPECAGQLNCGEPPVPPAPISCHEPPRPLPAH